MNKQKFNVNHFKNAVFKDGLRNFLEYRDLGISNATDGQYHAHIIRVKDTNKGDQEFHTTGLHQHLCKFQMVYILKGWIKFIYEGEGEHTFKVGDCILQPAGIVHNELSCSDDLELLEVYSPAKHETVSLKRK